MMLEADKKLFFAYLVIAYVTFSFFHRAIGYIMSTLFYPIVTFILIAICISYWAVTAVYPSVCIHLWRTVFCSARKKSFSVISP